MKLTDHKNEIWSPHHSAVDAVEAPPSGGEPWTLLCNGVDILASHKFLRGHENRVVWEALTKIGSDWIRVRVMFRHNSSVGHFWFWPVAGDDGMTAPRFDRKELHITATGVVNVDYVIETESRMEDDPINPGYTIGGILHGQGRAVRHIRVDFDALSWEADDGGVPLEPNDYCPLSPNRTGGEWAYMGITFPVEKISAHELYMMGGYGGYFQDEYGQLITEAQRPELQAGHTIDGHSRDQGWIHYTDPSNPWRDRMAVFEANQDDQHMSQWSVLAQLAVEYPDDEGLQMLMEAAVHVYMRAVPVKSRGTTHHKSGQERAQGRILGTGVDLFLGLRQNSASLALLAVKRAIDRWLIDQAAFIRRLENTGLGFAEFGSTGAYSANEIGIHYQKIWRLHRASIDVGAESVHYWMREASKWLFESFRYYDIKGNRQLSHPYFEAADHSNASGPVSIEHFAWLGATHYEPKNPTDRDKMGHILALGKGFDLRFKG